MRVQDTPDKFLRIDFDSWGAFVDHAENRKAPAGRSLSSRDDHWTFRGTKNIAEALRLARDGWPDGEKIVKGLSDPVFDFVSSKIERAHWLYDVEGTEIDVARYLDGEPECWQHQETRITDGPGRRLVRVVYNMSVSAGVSVEVMRAKGAAVAALVQLLDFAGHGVELAIAVGLRSGSPRLSRATSAAHVYIAIKAADQPLDMSRVAYALAHPSTFRRLFFSIMEGFPEWAYRAITSHSYGHPSTVDERGDIYIDEALLGAPHWLDPAAARAWVLTKLREQGVHLREDAA